MITITALRSILQSQFDSMLNIVEWNDVFAKNGTGSAPKYTYIGYMISLKKERSL